MSQVYLGPCGLALVMAQQGLLSTAVGRLLRAVASLVAERGLWVHGLSCSDVPCPGGRFLSRWTTREVLGDVLSNLVHRKLGKGVELGATGTVLSWDRWVLG